MASSGREATVSRCNHGFLGLKKGIESFNSKSRAVQNDLSVPMGGYIDNRLGLPLVTNPC